MSTTIYYFSGTGNSLAVAKDLAAELGDSRIVPIPKALKNDQVEPAEAVGIVYPVYMFGLPLILVEFLNRLKVNKGAYVFSVATMGGLPGRAHALSRRILKKRCIELAAGFSVAMPGNYTPLYGAIPPERQQERFEKAKLRVKEIAAFVRGRRQSTFEESPFLLNFLLYALLYRGGTARIPLAGKNYWLTDSCTRCGLCAMVCPVGNITLVEGRPSWLDHCQQCMACLQWCPAEAIQYGKSTLGRRRYRHPAVNEKDFIIR